MAARITPDSIYGKVLVFVALLVAIPCAATWYGHGKIAWEIFGGCVLLLWLIAPARRWPTAEMVTEDVDLAGKVALITGPTSGIGTETARVLAKRGAHVILAARSATKLEQTKKEIEVALASDKGERLISPKLTCLVCDLNDTNSVRKAAQEFIELGLPLHILVCNAGIMALPTREETKQGLEKQVGVCHVGHFLLVKLLMPCLEKARASRVVVLSSSAHRISDGADYLKDPKLDTQPYDGWAAYGNAKMSNMLFARELHARSKDKGVSAFSLHPGGIHTGLQGHVSWTAFLAYGILTPFVFKSIPQGAATTLLCATQEGLEERHGGKYFEDVKPTDKADKVAKHISDQLGSDAQVKLWEDTETLVNSV